MIVVKITDQETNSGIHHNETRKKIRQTRSPTLLHHGVDHVLACRLSLVDLFVILLEEIGKIFSGSDNSPSGRFVVEARELDAAIL